jgi:hypothetical protein
MFAQIFFWIVFVVLLFAMVLFDLKFSLLRDSSAADRKPYSFARVQLAWWSIIILTSFITIVATRGFPTLATSTLILLGISSATAAAAKVIDISDKMNPKISMIQDQDGQNIILDILSDENGVSIYRFQTVVFNLTFGIWFMLTVLERLVNSGVSVSEIMPVVEPNNLILLGLSSATYAALKTTENKSSEAQPASVPDESLRAGTGAQG